MRILVAKNAGFCFGVRNAVETAMSVKGKACTLGELIHNDYVNKKLSERGIDAINSLDEYDGGTVVIRSHGVPERTERELKEKGIPYIDATCPFVKKIHNLVRKYASLGYGIVIIGAKDHPEVVGINGWCGDKAYIVDDEDDVKSLPEGEKLCVVVQTTYSENKYDILLKSIENRCKTVEKFRTICYTTTDRQSETEELAKKCDAMLVIGSKSSSNTTKLFEIATRYCDNTYFIENIADISSVIENKHNFKILGVTAGASTPKELIEEVVKQMSDTQNTNKDTEFGKLFEASEKKNTDIKAGKIFRECTVISANEEGIIINFGGKKDGFIDKTDAELDGIEYVPANYKAGDKIAAMVIEKQNKKGNDSIAFSKKAVDKRNQEDKEAEEAIRGGEFKVTIDRVVKGGLEGKLGSYKIFVPASQIRIGYVTDLEKYVGKTLRLRAIEPKKAVKPEEAKEVPAEGAATEATAEVTEAPVEVAEQPKEITIKRGRSIVASQRVILEEEKAQKEDELWSKLTVGSIVNGKVKRLTDFGAFVSVYGFDCLAHIADLSHYSVAHPSDVLEIGKSYDFVILKANRETNRVSLGYKQLQKKPYELAAEKYPVGSVITGKVRSVFPYGIFVLIERDVDGLVPVSELSRSYVKNPADLYKEGDEVTAQVIKFNDNKITLSIKALLPEEEKKAEDIEISDEEYQEAKEKRASRNAKKFEKPANVAPRKKPAKKAAEEEETTSWQSESAGATLGDLFNLMNFAGEEEKAEEKPAKKSASKKAKAEEVADEDKKDEGDGE